MSYTLNDPRAEHTCFSHGFGTCVKFIYKGYEVSLAMDGEDTRIFRDTVGDALAVFQGTGLESIVEAKNFIDEIVK
jgi:hypothetical protein